MSKNNKSKKNSKKNPKGVNYICGRCGAEEIIPYEVLEQFDLMFPEEILYGPHMLKCEKCVNGIMQPKHYEAKVKGYGLYEDINYSINIENKDKK